MIRLDAPIWEKLSSAGNNVDRWLRELLEKSGEEKPKDLARLVMEESEKRVGAADDRTAVVVRLKNREGL